MKTTIFLSLRFLIATLVLSVVLTLCVELYELVVFRPIQSTGLVESLGMVFPVSLFLGLLFTFFFLPGKPNRSGGIGPWFVPWTVLLSLAFLLFLFGFSGISRTIEKSGSPAWELPLDHPVFLMDRIDRRVYGKIFVPGEVSKETQEGPEQVVVLNGRDRGPEGEQNIPRTWFSRDPKLRIDVDGFLLQGQEKEEKLFLFPGRADTRRLYRFPSSLEGVKQDLLLFMKDLSLVEQSSFGHYLLLVFLITFFFLSLSIFARITLWPLANIVILLIMFRVFFVLYRIFSSPLVNDLLPLEGFPPPIRGVELLLFTTAFVLLLMDILFVGDRVLGKAR